MSSSTKSIFPLNFRWGAATAAYQIEGAWNEGGKGESIWDRFSHTPGKVANGDTGDVACDHYHRLGEDVELMRELGIRNYRFSISWPRVMPSGRGVLNKEGIEFYDRLIDELLESGIEPFITLYHWDLPQQLQDIGGWLNRDVGKYFADYAAAMVKRYGDRVKNWTTLNEPWVVAHLGYRTGEMAPGVQDEKQCYQVFHNLFVAHGLAVRAMREAHSDIQCGIVLILFPTEPASDSPQDKAASEYGWHKDSCWQLDPLLKSVYPSDAWNALGSFAPQVEPGDMALISQQLDFLGVNYYFRAVVSAAKGRLEEIPGASYTDMGWEVHAESLRHLLERINREYKLPPLYITENGAAYKDERTGDGRIHDTRRIQYIRDHLLAAHQSIQNGVDLRGYFCWSLLDNFEWAHGYSKRFGLVHVDYETLKRTPKDSARWYSRVIRRNGLDEVLSMKAPMLV